MSELVDGGFVLRDGGVARGQLRCFRDATIVRGLVRLLLQVEREAGSEQATQEAGSDVWQSTAETGDAVQRQALSEARDAAEREA